MPEVGEDTQSFLGKVTRRGFLKGLIGLGGAVVASQLPPIQEGTASIKESFTPISPKNGFPLGDKSLFAYVPPENLIENVQIVISPKDIQQGIATVNVRREPKTIDLETKKPIPPIGEFSNNYVIPLAEVVKGADVSGNPQIPENEWLHIKWHDNRTKKIEDVYIHRKYAQVMRP